MNKKEYIYSVVFVKKYVLKLHVIYIHVGLYDALCFTT